MNDVRQGQSQVCTDFSNDMLRNAVALRRQSKHLFSRDAFGSCVRHPSNGGLRLRIIYREANHCTRNCLGRSNSFEMTEGATRTFWAILFDQHMAYLACRTCCAVINLATQYQAAADTTSQSHIQYIALTGTYAALNFCQRRGIRVVINYTRYIKLLFEVTLQGKIIPSMSMMEG